MLICSYEHPDNAMLKFWDVPGVGTADHYPRESTTYLSHIDVDLYDFFLLITADRFTENDAWLANELHKRNKKYLFVRTNIAKDISTNNPNADNEDAVLEAIRRDVTDQLRENGRDDDAPPAVFLVDAIEPDKYEFAKLQQQIVADFPDQKRSSLILSLHAGSEELIRLKATELRTQVWTRAALSGAGAMVPIPGVSTAIDLGIVTHEALRYFRQLGLDGRSLRNNAKLHRGLADPNRMRAIVAKTLGIKFKSSGPDGDDTITLESMRSIVTMIVKRSPTLVAATAVEEGVKVVPLLGCVIAPPLSFAGTRSALHLILDKFEETALRVMNFIVAQSAAVVLITDKTKDVDEMQNARGSSPLSSSSLEEGVNLRSLIQVKNPLALPVPTDDKE